MMAYLSGNKIATGVDHLLYGWVFFGGIIFIMYSIGAIWSEPPAASSPASGAAGMPRPGTRAQAARSMLATMLVGALIVLLPPVTLGALGRADSAASAAKIELPVDLAGGWSDKGAHLPEWTPKFGSPSVETTRAYVGPGGTVGVYLAYYRGQDEDRKLVSSQNVLVAMRDTEWNLMAGGSRDVAAGQKTIGVRTAEMLGRPKPGTLQRPHLVVWHVYWVDGRFIAGDVAAKIASALAQLRGRGDDGASIVLYADADSPRESAAALADFVNANFDALDALLRRTRDRR
jgi:EpsI family protein